MTQLRKKVDFKNNVPIAVALAYDDGILKQDGRFGDYWIYSLQDERVMFVPPVVHDQIKKLNISRGQAFTVTKQEKRVGNKRVIDWMVDFAENTGEGNAMRAHDCSPRTEPESSPPPLLAEMEQPPAADGAAPGPAQEPGPATAGHGEPTEASPVNGSAATVTTPADAAAPVADKENGNGAAKPNGSGSANGKGTANGAGQAAGEKSNTSPLFRASMRAAIDALIDAEAYAAKKNYSVRFTNEDLRATAISIFIAVREGYTR